MNEKINDDVEKNNSMGTKEEDGKNYTERIMNDVALGASACGERMYHPSTRRKFTTTTTTFTSDESSDNSDSSDSDSTSSRGSFSAREEKKMKSERARLSQT